jgi:hypothetical protein
MKTVNVKQINESISKLYLGSLIYDIEQSDWFQIRDTETLQYVIENWGKLFKGIELTYNVISTFFSDFLPSYDSSYSIKYSLFRNEDGTLSLASFYGIYEKNEIVFKNFDLSDMDLPNKRHLPIIQYFAGVDVFKDFYCLRNQKRIHLKYVHELFNLIDFVVFKRLRPGKRIIGLLPIPVNFLSNEI